MPVVVVVDDEVSVTATLHHERCQEPRWTRLGLLGVHRFVSTTASLTRVPFGDPGRVPFLPTVIANPSLEEVTLSRTDQGRYRATTVDSYRPLGLVPPGGTLPLGSSEHVECWVSDEALVMRCAAQLWTIPLGGPRDADAAEIRRLGEVVLGISTALDPVGMKNPEPIKRVLRAADIALVRVALSERPAPTLTGPAVLVESELADADESCDIDWLPEKSPYPGPTYDPKTGRFEAGIGMDGPKYWRLHTSGLGVHNGLVAGPPGIGKTNMLRVITVEALASTVFCYSLADPLDRNGLIDVLGEQAEAVARTRADSLRLLRGLAATVQAREPLAERYRDPSPRYPGMLLVMDDAQAVLADPAAAELAEQVAVAGPPVGVGLVVSTLTVDPHDFGDRPGLVIALSTPNSFVFNAEQAHQLSRLLRQR